MVIGGGLGTVVGPVVGAILFTQLPEFLRFSDEWRLVIYGAILVLLVRFLPRGLWGSATALVRGFRRRSSDDDPEGGPPFLRDAERPTEVDASDPREAGPPGAGTRASGTMPSLSSVRAAGGVE
jgi:MFS family permease